MRKKQKHIDFSIVTPVYQAERILPVLIGRIGAVMKTMKKSYEIVCVEDGSRDKSWDVLVKLATKNKHLKAIRLTKNFGQHNALNAGLQQANGNFTVIMDCDLQDNPSYIPQLFKALTGNVQFILTRKIVRTQTWFRKTFGSFFYRVLSWCTGQTIDYNIGGYSLLTKEVVSAYNAVKETNKYYLPTLLWLGYPYRVIPVRNDPRYEGKSSYTLTKLIKHGVFSLIMSSDVPLKIAITIGLFFMILSFLVALYIFGQIIFFHQTFLTGWTSLMIAFIFLSGIILFCIGMTGLYIAQILEQVRGRKPYTVIQTKNL